MKAWPSTCERHYHDNAMSKYFSTIIVDMRSGSDDVNLSRSAIGTITTLVLLPLPHAAKGPRLVSLRLVSGDDSA